jgi:hypothetical protein
MRRARETWARRTAVRALRTKAVSRGARVPGYGAFVSAI